MKHLPSALIPLCLLLSVALTALTGCTGSSVPLCSDRYDNAEAYTTGNFEYDPATVSAVRIRWYLGSVELTEVSDTASTGRLLSVSESGRDLAHEQQMHHWLDGTVLNIQCFASGYSGTLSAALKEVTVEIPAGIEVQIESTAADVRFQTHTLHSAVVRSTSGTIRALDLTAEEILLSSVSGGIDCGTLRADTVTLQTTSGHHTADCILTAESFSAGSVSGAVRLGSLSAPTAEIETTSGRVDLLLTDCPQLTVTTVSGAVAVTLPADTGATLSYRTVSGTLKAKNFVSEGSGRYQLGDGTLSLQVESTSGSLTIKQGS